MYNIEEIKKYNHDFFIEQEELERKEKKLKEINNNISIDAVNNLNYEDLKELIEIMSYKINDEIKLKLREILSKKKIEKYPQLNEVHYFPEINKIGWLTKEKKMNIDKTLSKRSIKMDYISSLDDKTKEFLLSEGIIDKQYVISCFHSGCFSEKYISESKYQKMFAYWQKESNGEPIDDEEYEECDYGSITINCELEDIEITNIEEFNNYLQKVYYRVIKKPDLSLDTL